VVLWVTFIEYLSAALKNLTENHAKKPKNLPITSDVIILRQHLYKTAENAIQELNNDPSNLKAFKNLSEATLTIVIVHNRKRQGDVEFTLKEDYLRDMTTVHQDEMIQTLSEAEKMFVAETKRINTTGKGSRSVPILFPKSAQKFVVVMLSARNQFVPEKNAYLFALDSTEEQRINGAYTLRKFANSCGAQHPATLTSTRLRKQIATVLQVLNLSETEKEQLATFMGHTKETHEQYYR
jgi:hypothetical protein